MIASVNANATERAEQEAILAKWEAILAQSKQAAKNQATTETATEASAEDTATEAAVTEETPAAEETTATPEETATDYAQRLVQEQNETTHPTNEGDNAKFEDFKREIKGRKATFMDVVRGLRLFGKKKLSEIFSRNFFDVTKTPEYMKELGLTGDKFTIGYGVMSSHFGKDDGHTFSDDIWEQLPEALKRPFAITRYYTDEQKSKLRGFRLYTTLNVNGNYIVVGVDVKNGGRDLQVNSISTLFGRDGGITNKEDVIYRSEAITPEQSYISRPKNRAQNKTGKTFKFVFVWQQKDDRRSSRPRWC